MKTLIGIVPENQNADGEIQQLVRAGVAKTNIRTLASSKSCLDVIGCKPAGLIAGYGALGALLVGGVYFLLAVVAGWCECNLFNFDPEVLPTVILGGVLAGVFVGGGLGIFVGISRYEDTAFSYVDAVRRGHAVIAVEAPETEALAVQRRLQAAGWKAVKMLPRS